MGYQNCQAGSAEWVMYLSLITFKSSKKLWPQATSVSNYQKQAQQKLSNAELCFGIVLQSDKVITLKENSAPRLINISSYLTTPKQ